MKNSIYEDDLVFHTVIVYNNYPSEGYTAYNFYLGPFNWKCIIETSIPNQLVLADSLKNAN